MKRHCPALCPVYGLQAKEQAVQAESPLPPWMGSGWRKKRYKEKKNPCIKTRIFYYQSPILFGDRDRRMFRKGTFYIQNSLIVTAAELQENIPPFQYKFAIDNNICQFQQIMNSGIGTISKVFKTETGINNNVIPVTLEHPRQFSKRSSLTERLTATERDTGLQWIIPYFPVNLFHRPVDTGSELVGLRVMTSCAVMRAPLHKKHIPQTWSVRY
jgi:hypothetical protein